MAGKKKSAKKIEAAKPARKKLDEVALVLRVPKEAVAYEDRGPPPDRVRSGRGREDVRRS